MNHTHKPHAALPLVGDVDVLVVGGSSAGVQLALGCRDRGLSVMLVAPFSYLGEDICAGFRFWGSHTKEMTDLGEEIFGTGKLPPTPMHVKMTLEQRMVQAAVPFLLNCQTAGILTNPSGWVCGAVIANRSGRQCIKARLVVDATLEGRVFEQAGRGERHQPSGRQPVDYTILYNQSTVDLSTLEGEDLPGFTGDEYALIARRFRYEIDFGDGSPEARARGINELNVTTWRPGEFRHPSWLTPACPEQQNAPATNSEDLWWQDGLLALTESVQLAEGREHVFCCPVRGMALAEACCETLVARLEETEALSDLSVSCSNAKTLDTGEVRSLTDALRPGLRAEETLPFNPNSVPLLGTYDVVVAGGGTGGAPAGISAARAGAKTLIVEAASDLGGVGTIGQITQYWCGNRSGFNEELDQGVAELEVVEEGYDKGPQEWSVPAKSEWYRRTAHREGATIWFNTLCVGAWVVDGRVRGVLVSGPFGYGLVEAGCVVDSTGCSDVPAAAGAPTLSIGKDHVAVQGTGLAGVNPGRNYHNSDHNFSDDTDVVDATAFLVSSKLKFEHDFDCGELIDSRERRQIVGDLTLDPVDVLYQRRFPDTVCVATSNFDSHGFTIHPVFMLVPPDKETPHWADVPFRCMLPQGLDGVLVTGLGLSAHRDVLPVVRMQADVQNQGYAAGYAAAMSALNSRTPLRDLNLADLKQHLVDVGNLPPRVLTDVDNFPVSDDELKAAVEHGLHELKGLSLVLSDPARSVPLLKEALAQAEIGSERRLRCAQILALHNDATGESVLIDALNERPWDEGWNYRGMHQFGMSMSVVDGLLVALGRIGSASAWPCILNKADSLPASVEFSHYRALAMACETLYARHPDPRAAKALAALLERPGFCGHAQLNQQDVQAAVSSDLNDNTPRNLALRELHVARGLYRCGDINNRAQVILTRYSADLRGHFARHARSLLASD